MSSESRSTSPFARRPGADADPVGPDEAPQPPCHESYLVKAAWYEHRGPAREVLVPGEMPALEPGPGEVRIRLSWSGINPGDIKKREGWQSTTMPYALVIPHSDGAGIVEAVGPGVPAERIGQAAWCYGAQSYRPFGTAAQTVVVPAGLAVALPDSARQDTELLKQAACLGIAGITGYRAVFADGPVQGLTVLVWGGASGVGAIAVQMARRGGARVLAVVRSPAQVAQVLALGAHQAWLADDADLAAHIRKAVPQGVDRIADVDFAAHIDTDAAVIAVGGTIAAYFSSVDRPAIPYWTLGFADVTLRLLGSDDFSPAVKATAAAELTLALVAGQLRTEVGAVFPLADIAAAHERIESGARGRTLLSLD